MTMTLEEMIDQNLDAVLRASGSALRHYTMPRTLADMRAAMSAAMAPAGAVWIDLKDQKPKEAEWVLIALESGAVVTGCRYSAGWHWDDTDDLADGDAAATHWQPIPVAPRRAKK